MVAKELDFVEVEAEVLEPEHVSMVPAVIDADSYLRARAAWLERMMEPYDGMDDKAIERLDLRDARSCRADLNRIIKEVEAERKAIKNAYQKPLAQFESEVAKLLEPAREAERKLKEHVDGCVETQRIKRHDALECEYEDFAPALVPVVPFDRLLELHPQWLNASFNKAKAVEELQDEVSRIAHSWKVLQGQREALSFYDECEAVFFRTLSLEAALQHDSELSSDRERIDQLVDEVSGAAQPNDEELERTHYIFSVWLSDSEVEALRVWKTKNAVGADWHFREA